MQRQNIVKAHSGTASFLCEEKTCLYTSVSLLYTDFLRNHVQSGSAGGGVTFTGEAFSMCIYEFNIEYHELLRTSHASRATNVSTMLLNPQTPLFKVT